MTFMSRDEYEEARAEDWLEDVRLEREDSGMNFGDPEDFDPIWEATVRGELDRVDEGYLYDGDEDW